MDIVEFLMQYSGCRYKIQGTKYNQYSHLLGGVIMLLIGVLLLLKPEWLMFQFK